MYTRENNDPPLKGLLENVKEYAQLQIDLLKINLIEKASRLISMIIVAILAVLLLVTAFIYLSMAFIHWMATFFGSMIPGFLMVGGFFILLFVIFYLLRNKVFLNPIIKKISGILFDKKHKSSSKK